MPRFVELTRSIPADARDLHTIRCEPSASRHQPLRRYSIADLASLLDARGRDPLTPEFAGKVQWTIRAAGEVCGWVSLDVTSREHGLGSVGYTIGERWRGQGIATRALASAIDLGAFDPAILALERLDAVAAVGNIGSHRVLERNCFRPEGIARGLLIIGGERIDHMRFGRLRTDRIERHPR